MLKNILSKTAWGLYINETGICAVKVTRKATKVSVESFDMISYSECESEHAEPAKPEDSIQFKPFPVEKESQATKTLSTSTNINDLADLARNAISLFLSRNNIESSDRILIAVPDQFVLSRFVNLPNVKSKQLRNIVRFEIGKHIPIDVSEIIWDYQSFSNKSSNEAEVEVGIFAIKKESIYTFLSSFKQIENYLTTIQIGSIALYNFLLFNEDEIEPTMLLEIGQDNTNLMILCHDKVWLRNLPSIGLGEGFIDEVNRSVGYYRSLVKSIEVKFLVISGSLSIEHEKKEEIAQSLGYELKEIVLKNNNILTDEIKDKEKFKNNCLCLITPLGLAMQGISQGEITLNLLPDEFAKKIAFYTKKKVVMLSSLVILVSVFILCVAQFINNKSLQNTVNTELDTFNNATELERQYKKKEKVYNKLKKELDQISSIGEGKAFWNKVIPRIFSTIPEKAILYSLDTNWVTKPEKAVSMRIKGKSFSPRLDFIYNEIKGAFEKIVLVDDDKDIPLFDNIKVVKGSLKHATDGIGFEIEWIIKYKTFLLFSDI